MVFSGGNLVLFLEGLPAFAEHKRYLKKPDEGGYMLHCICKLWA